jgi:GNAT superfamily N-acetyltransferase
MSTNFSILREKDPAWWTDIRDICCATGGSNGGIEPERWDFFGELWVGPYQKLAPQWTYVVLKDQAVVGYLTGCPVTRAFEVEKKYKFDVLLALKIFFGYFRKNNDTRRFLRRFFGLDKSPEKSFSKKTLKHINDNYPAHLHMNLLSEARGLGAGRALLNSYFADLRSKSISGVHLFCGEDARKFYQKMDFADLAQIEFRPGVNVYLMGKTIN